MENVHLGRFDFIFHLNQSEEDKAKSSLAWDFTCQIKLSINLECIKKLKFLLDSTIETYMYVNASTMYICN